MEILFILAGPAVLSFVVLASMRPNRAYLMVLALALCLCGLLAAAPVPPASGPDDWYNGIGRAGGLMGIAGVLLTVPAQAARRFIPLRTGGYLVVLAVTLALAFLILTLLPGI